jgi:hypothetical protein
VKIDKAEALGKLARGLMRFVIAGNYPEAVAEWFENLAAAFETFSECRQIAGVDVNVRRLRDDSRECT